MDHEDDDPGTTWNERARNRQARLDEHRVMAWRAIQAALPKGCDHLVRHRQQLRHRQRLSVVRARAANTWRRACSAPAAMACPPFLARKIGCPDVPVVGFAGDGAFGISMNEMTAMRPRRMAGDHHDRVPQLPVGREKRNTTLWFDDNFRRHRAGRRRELCQDRRGLRPERRVATHHGRADRGADKAIKDQKKTA